MNVPELIIWLIPGYLALRLYFTVNPFKSKQGYEWFFQTGGAGLLCFVLARLILLAARAVESLLPCFWGRCLDLNMARSVISQQFPFAYAPTFVIGALVGVPLTAVILNAVRGPWAKLQIRFKRWFTESTSADLLYYACRQLEGEQVLLTLENGKVYVGLLVDFTSDPDETEKYLKIVPIMSGHRDPKTFRVEYTTAYVRYVDAASKATAQELIIPVKQLVTFARFDDELHDWFVRAGLTVMNLPDPQLGAAEVPAAKKESNEPLVGGQ
jgi:hypothetical protein